MCPPAQEPHGSVSEAKGRGLSIDCGIDPSKVGSFDSLRPYRRVRAASSTTMMCGGPRLPTHQGPGGARGGPFGG